MTIGLFLQMGYLLYVKDLIVGLLILQESWARSRASSVTLKSPIRKSGFGLFRVYMFASVRSSVLSISLLITKATPVELPGRKGSCSSVIWDGPGGLRASPSAAQEARTKAGKGTEYQFTAPSVRLLRGEDYHILGSHGGYMFALLKQPFLSHFSNQYMWAKGSKMEESSPVDSVFASCVHYQEWVHFAGVWGSGEGGLFRSRVCTMLGSVPEWNIREGTESAGMSHLVTSSDQTSWTVVLTIAVSVVEKP
ncbi:hypothetical protein CY34DRAFT_104660 [Suillus luteus UH-Slu-Lm8-n1]|uniref:Uncharacterized protein n=1 Tax=Suillus luteus UH-Slu-Lm8-n1 TaxID=930992 RepID=A0A0D0BBJ6_9AGAM|nr:hypothetical protein CY34DRAFT_104660 [Suillus luteus UH-Slu-Lm8-n1]